MGYNKLKLALMQPTFNPWLGYFDLIDYVDKFIIFDTVQLSHQSWQTRNKLKVQNRELLFSIPIMKNQSKKEILIKDALINFNKFDFRKKLARTLEQNYKKAQYFNQVNSFIQELIWFDTNYLSDYNINIINQISKKIEMQTKIIILSETDYISDYKKGDLVLDICKYFDTTDYISPLGSKEYLDREVAKFNNSNIEVFYQYYQHPTYGQLGKEFLPYIGIFDLLYNEGFEKSSKIIRSGRKYKKAE